MPFLATFFVYILTANWLGLLPGFVAPTRDLSVTVGLALLLLIWIHAYAIRKWDGRSILLCFFLQRGGCSSKLDGTHKPGYCPCPYVFMVTYRVNIGCCCHIFASSFDCAHTVIGA